MKVARGQKSWVVFIYELQMYDFLRKVPNNPNCHPLVKNALVESRIFHTRILVELFLSSNNEKDNITIKDLLIGYRGLINQGLIDNLNKKYGKRETKSSVRFAFNKLAAHPTIKRKDSYSYWKVFNWIDPPIIKIIQDLYRVTGRKELENF
jgi:hypothetical protein